MSEKKKKNSADMWHVISSFLKTTKFRPYMVLKQFLLLPA